MMHFGIVSKSDQDTIMAHNTTGIQVKKREEIYKLEKRYQKAVHALILEKFTVVAKATTHFNVPYDGLCC